MVPVMTTDLRTREQQIIALLIDGHPNKVIAFRLGIREDTVKSHLVSIYRKHDVKGRVALAVLQLRQGSP